MTNTNHTYSDQIAKLVDEAGLPQGYDEKIAKQIRDMARKNTGKKVSGVAPWPGCPTSQLPLIFTPTFHAMLAAGEVEIVERPKATNPAQTARFFRLTQKA